MATPNPANILHSPGRLSFGPADLTTAYPHGGTSLGIVRQIAASPNAQYRSVTAEEYGGEVVEQLYVGEAWTLAAILREYDDDAMAAIFQNTSTGSVSQHTLIEHPGANRAGRLLVAAKGIILVFTPDAPDTNFVVFHRAIPMVGEAAELSLSHNTPMEIAVVFAGVRDAAGKMVSVGRAEDITL